ncbi:MAG: cytochrome c3 family protein [Prolixibacteraceae bacterium]|nr:cytochrome c3 family protein [Prolixibacteraceae bacterium]
MALFLFSCIAGTAKSSDSHSGKHSRSDVKQGERYYKGLLPKASPNPSCVSCHYYKPADTINWNPASIEIAELYLNKSSEDLEEVLLSPFGKVMSVAHANIDVPQDQIQYVKAYMDNLAENGLPKDKPSFLKLLLFLLIGGVMTWALLDLIFFHKVKFKAIPILIILLALGYQLNMAYEAAVKLGRSDTYQPDQPIKFSHKVHAGDNKIDCMYCHHTADESKSANIPSTSLCMNCHIVVREGARSGKFEIKKLVEAYEEGRSIEWVRIHQLPDHVFFAHAQHVGAGKLDCAQCHGAVEEMHILKQENDLSMGWCLNCHRETKVDFEDNEYYQMFDEFHKELSEGTRDSIMASDIGANECSKCHY